MKKRKTDFKKTKRKIINSLILANLKEMDVEKGDTFESWIAAEFIPIYNKVRNYNKQMAEVNELKSKVYINSGIVSFDNDPASVLS